MDKIFLSETFDLIGCTTIIGALYGIIFILYCLCARPLYLKLGEPDNRYQARFSLGYISLIFFCVTGNLATNSRVIQLAYINHANFRGGPLEYEISVHSLAATIGTVLELFIEGLTMVIQIRRLWIVWSGTEYAIATIILPILLLLSFIGLDIIGAMVPQSVKVNQFGFTHQINVAIGSARYAALSSFTILVTGLITVRILRVRQRHMRIMSEMSEAASPYLSIIAMLVESYILDSAWSLASAILISLGHPSQIMFITNDPLIKIIAYLLVVYRVETGRGWTKQTETNLTSLRWNHGSTTSDNRSQVPATATIVTTGSQPIIHSNSEA